MHVEQMPLQAPNVVGKGHTLVRSRLLFLCVCIRDGIMLVFTLPAKLRPSLAKLDLNHCEGVCLENGSIAGATANLLECTVVGRCSHVAGWKL